MRRLEWNALHVGDRILMHDDHDSGLPLLPGIVAIVEVTAGSNDVGVRVDHPSRLLRPARLAVHLDPLDASTECWRCEVTVGPVAEPTKVEAGARR
jgi:hypothetical protein